MKMTNGQAALFAALVNIAAHHRQFVPISNVHQIPDDGEAIRLTTHANETFRIENFDSAPPGLKPRVSVERETGDGFLISDDDSRALEDALNAAIYGK
jgi:hypothetical protein